MGLQRSRCCPSMTAGTAETPAIWSVDTTPPTVQLSVPAYVPGEPTFAFSATDPNSLPGGLTYTCALDGAVAASCVSPFSPGSLTRAAHTLTVTATDPSGNVSDQRRRTSWSTTWSRDARCSRRAVESLGYTYPLTAGCRFHYHLSAVDTGSGVRSFQARHETSVMGTATGSTAHWFTVAAVERCTWRLGIAPASSSARSTRSATCRGRAFRSASSSPLDDRLMHVVGWTRDGSTVAVDGTVSVATRKGATMTRTGFHGRRVELVVREGPVPVGPDQRRPSHPDPEPASLHLARLSGRRGRPRHHLLGHALDRQVVGWRHGVHRRPRLALTASCAGRRLAAGRERARVVERLHVRLRRAARRT